ncbi:hypothetical protein, conserved [Eimeria tenella]|uniref:Uncharacterized protein n=1 Tax=Eimeria tenella TaxID=5802 RepID=U6KNM7_EIMTE|nr:hypothetical protein, conserved [Eimeria tenella]CDJ37058.1 hypothetical protein, conserved [Eimeria tenella]|eukprot:XP_013227896.1 hypothetical protein, conserved [Eimeria tenella]
MHFVECAALARPNFLLQQLAIGDRVFVGRLELLGIDRDRQQTEALRALIESQLTSSPLFAAPAQPPLLLSPAAAAASSSSSSSRKHRQQDFRGCTAKGKETLVNLIATLNQCFPDYEFSSTLTPAMFREEESVAEAQGDINEKLRAVEQLLPGFINELWTAIESAVCLSSCAVYSHSAAGSGEASALGCLWSCLLPPSAAAAAAAAADGGFCLSSFAYFFVEKQRDRVLFFACCSSSKLSSPSWLGALDSCQLHDQDDSEEFVPDR